MPNEESGSAFTGRLRRLRHTAQRKSAPPCSGSKRANPFVYHKTTIRNHYEQARFGLNDCDDVLLWNDEGEVTETTIANFVADLNGTLVTPPVSSGLLPGTFRDHLLTRGEITEKVIRLKDLQRCRKIYLINALRGWRSAILTEEKD